MRIITLKYFQTCLFLPLKPGFLLLNLSFYQIEVIGTMLGFTLRRHTLVRTSIPIVRDERGHKRITQGLHEFICPLSLNPLRRCQLIAFHFAKDLMGNANHLQSPSPMFVHIRLISFYRKSLLIP